jgi:redox-sensing transcriptional repressor
MGPVSEKTIGRLSLYRRLLSSLQSDAVSHVHSHQLAALAGGTAAQVRRDMMAVGYTGSPKTGYDVCELAQSIAEFLDAPQGQGVALIGVGNLGRAILAYFSGRRPHLSILAAFDADAYKVNRVIHGCHCYPMQEMPEIIAAQNIRTAILAVPAAEAQTVAQTLVRAGVRGILNFAPMRLRLPKDVYVEDIDMTMSLEKVAYFSRKGRIQKEVQQ